MYHNPVLLAESIAGLRISPTGIYADLTFGGGGHSQAILPHLSTGRLIAFDQDPRALENRIDDQRITMVNGNFRYLLQYLRYCDALPLDGILADLGVSSYQIDRPERGFTTRGDAPLDMRMDTGQVMSAEDLLRNSSEDELTMIFREFGELTQGRLIARAIIAFRSQQPITTSAMLKEAVKHYIPFKHEHKFLAQLFQAIRIAVNDEMAALQEMLLQCKDALKPGGRLVIIAYHSLEDRLVKHYLRSGNFLDQPEVDFFGKASVPFRVITRKAIVASEEEIAGNPRSRSARLRIGERN